MKHLRFMLLALGIGLAPLALQAQTTMAKKKAESPQPIASDVTSDQVSEELQEAADALSNLKLADKAGRLMALMALLATVFKLMVSGLKVAGTIGFFVRTEKQAVVIRMLTLALGGGVFFFTNVVAGMPWWEALFLAMSGPFSIVIHEFSKLTK